MRKFFKFLLILVSLFVSLASFQVAHATDDITPALNKGKKWRVGYVEGANYPDYAGTFFYLLKGLESLGWVRGVDKVPFAWGQNDTKAMWEYIAKTPGFSNYIEFSPNEYYSLASMPGKGPEVLQHIGTGKELDLVIVMGTVAGRLMSADTNQTNVMVFSTTNALKSGIVKSDEYSGKPRVWAHLDLEVYKQQLKVFSDIFPIRKLGVAYDDTPNGRVFAAVEDIETIAKAKNFQVIRKIVPGTKDAADQGRYFNELLAAHKELATQVDAFYYTVSPAPGLRPEDLYAALTPFYDKKIPVFSQFGDDEVKIGALLSIARADYAGVGHFGAAQIAKVLHGAPPDKLLQMYSDTPTIALNLQVAKQIGYKPPFEILLVSDKIFRSVETPPATVNK